MGNGGLRNSRRITIGALDGCGHLAMLILCYIDPSADQSKSIVAVAGAFLGDTVYRQIAADELDIPVERFTGRGIAAGKSGPPPESPWEQRFGKYKGVFHY
jgi:hypothetical protein